MTPPPVRSGGARARLARGTEILVAATCAGLLTGLAHAAILTTGRLLFHHFTWYSREFVWMAPVAYTLVFLAGAVPLLLLAAVRPGLVALRVTTWYFAVGGIFGLLLPYPQVSRVAALILAGGIAAQVARILGKREAWWRRAAPRLTGVLMVLVAAVAALQPLARAYEERRAIASLSAAPAGAPNVLVIILDTVRAASLSLYGFPFPTTPALERWAREGTTFEWAMAPSPWTLPSHASMFTGRYPGELATGWTTPLGRQPRVLAESFRARGYHTVGIVANHDYTAWDSGLARGFVHFEDYLVSPQQLLASTSYTQTSLVRGVLRARSIREAVHGLARGDLSIDPKHTGDPRRASNVTDRFLRWQAAHSDRPFFAFINYFDAHQGYFAPPGFSPVSTGRTTRYHTAIAWIDQNVDRLLATLRERGALDNTLLVVASDHGELFAEHGLSGHANSLYRNVLHVPLVFRLPGVVPAGLRIDKAVSLRDLAATLADLAGLGDDLHPGHSLRGTWERDTAISPALAEVARAPNVDSTQPNANGDLVALFDDRYHYIGSTSGVEELFEYRTDSLERRSLSATATDVTRRLRDRVALIRNSFQPVGR